MGRATERDIRDRLESYQTDTEDTASEVTVTWGDPDPEERPGGVRWDPPAEETPGRLIYDIWSSQRDALEATQGPADIVAFLAGYGSGKTILGSRWLLKQALEYDGSRFLIMGIDFQKARDTTFRALFEQLPGERTATVTSSYNGPETSPVVEDYNRQNHRLTLTNDTVIKLGSADRWNRYAGDSYGAVYCDEVGHYGDDLHDLLEMLGSRLRGVAGPKTQLWTLTGNGTHNPAYEILERGEDATGEDLGLRVETVRASTLENPYLDESEKDRFKRQFANTAREEEALHGGFAASGGQLLQLEYLSFIDVEDTPFGTDRPLRYYAGVDLGHTTDTRRAESADTDYTAVAVAGYDPRDGTAYLADVGRERGLSLRETVEYLGGALGDVPTPSVTVEAVGGQQYIIDELRGAINGTVIPEKPTTAKAARITDMGVLFDTDRALVVNSDPDEDLGYDRRWGQFVKEWSQFSEDDSHDTDDLLDAVYYCLHGIEFQQPTGANGGLQIETGDMYDRRA